MRKHESVKSNLEIPAYKGSAANSASSKLRKPLVSISLIAIFLLTAASAQENKNSKPEQVSSPAARTVRTHGFRNEVGTSGLGESVEVKGL